MLHRLHVVGEVRRGFARLAERRPHVGDSPCAGPSFDRKSTIALRASSDDLRARWP